MNIKLLGITAAVCGLMIACGDDTTGTGGSSAGGAAAGGNATTGGNTSTGGAATGGAATGGAGGGASCDEQFPAGADLAATLVITACGCTAGGPCETACMGDDACATPAPTTSLPACGDCIQMEADKGVGSACASGAAFDPACQNDAGCADYIACVLAGG